MTTVSRLFFLLICTQVVSGQSNTNTVLTNAIDVLSLPGERAWGFNVRIRGVVTAAQPSSALQPNWDGGMFVQDGTAGIYALATSRRSPQPGDLVEVTGISHPGGFAPFINDAQWTKLGTAPLPPAKVVPVEQLMSGIEDGQRVEISGVIRSCLEDKPMVMYEIASGGYRLKAFAPPLPKVDSQTLIGAKVRVRGTASTFYSGQLRQLISVELHVPFAADFNIEKTEPDDPFQSPLLPLNSLGQYRRSREFGERVHVKGTVTYQRPGEDVFLQDVTSGLQVKTSQTETLTAGDVVEAVGFLDFEHFLPVLRDAVFRKTGEEREFLKPKPAPIWELKAGYRHADLITLQGTVLDRTVRETSNHENAAAGQRFFLTLQYEGVFFSVEGFSPEPNAALAHIPIGSVVEVDGICLMEIEQDGEMRSLHLLLPTAEGVRILTKPSWLTPVRLRIGLAILLVVLVVALAWNVMIKQKNSALQVLVKEKNKAQQELQEAHDQLETRVAERTRQLKIEMTARQETEVRFKATLGERTRLAQEIHDTLEQSLTGIALQLDTTAKLFQNKPEAANHHLELARNQVTQSQVEVRRSIWDLRSRALEQFDLPGALTTSSNQLTEGTPVQFKITTKGRVRPLPEIVEENLLRIGQEAMNNVIKHSQATTAEIQLDYGPKVITLQVSDNGRGFELDQTEGPTGGHFGLLGISERAKRLNAGLTIKSEPGKGTIVMVQVVLDREPHPLDSSEL